ncbi:MAG: hypothetical protein FWG80_03495 [Alphaproteobacteria bacterium]|nr:hypothetical protein [Alphaproteobacteria bacterium]
MKNQKKWIAVMAVGGALFISPALANITSKSYVDSNFTSNEVFQEEVMEARQTGGYDHEEAMAAPAQHFPNMQVLHSAIEQVQQGAAGNYVTQETFQEEVTDARQTGVYDHDEAMNATPEQFPNMQVLRSAIEQVQQGVTGNYVTQETFQEEVLDSRHGGMYEHEEASGDSQNFPSMHTLHSAIEYVQREAVGNYVTQETFQEQVTDAKQTGVYDHDEAASADPEHFPNMQVLRSAIDQVHTEITNNYITTEEFNETSVRMPSYPCPDETSGCTLVWHGTSFDWEVIER